MDHNKNFHDIDSFEEEESDDDEDDNYVSIVRNVNGQPVIFQKSRSLSSQFDEPYPKSAHTFDMMDHSKRAGIFRKSNNIPMKDIATPKTHLSQLSNNYFYNMEIDELQKSNCKKQESSVTFYSSPLSNSFCCRFLMCILAILMALLLVSTAVLLMLYYNSDRQSDFITFTFDFIHKMIRVLFSEKSQHK